MEYTLRTGFREDAGLRCAFNGLATATFGLTFEPWYRGGYWTEKYEPHTLFDGSRAVANVSVNHMTLEDDQGTWRFLQLGTVMVAQGYRGKGLARYLMELVLDKYAGQWDGVYLLANGGVLHFYPKFGFRPATEYQYSALLRHYGGGYRRLDLDTQEDRSLLRRSYERSNPYCALNSRENFELYMFYCQDFLKHDMYYFPDQESLVIARQQGDTLVCYDVLGGGERHLGSLLSAIAGPGTGRTVLGFAPANTDAFAAAPIDTDDHLFILEGGRDPLGGAQRMLPLLSHA